MDSLALYIKKCISPRNEFEFSERDELTNDVYEKMSQDSFVISLTPPPTPPTDLRVEFISLNNKYIIKKAIKNIEWLDEKTNKINFVQSRDPIYRRLIPPPTETVEHPYIISCFIEEYKKENIPINYVEYGVRLGETLFQISKLVDNCYGVDVVKRIEEPENCKYFQMKTDEFSQKYLPAIKFNVAFIDADHSSVSAFRDFENLFKYIDVGGYIFMHDTYPCSNNMLYPSACNDCYKTPIKIKDKYKNVIEILTLPFNPGVTVVKKVSSTF